MATSPALAPSTIEATIIRKLQTHIIPFVFVLFLIAYIDRINIGFAALTMNRELGIASQQFGFLSGIFFFGYSIFEIPSNLLLHKIGAQVWFARILISWGIVAVLTGFATTATHLYYLRFLLGVAEAGYVPGILLYLSYWFPQRRLAHATALFCAANPLASVVGAPLSGVILDHVHWFGISSWRWLLILEGFPAIAGGILTYLLLPSRAEKAKFLTAQEKGWMAAELSREGQQKESCPVTLREALTHGRVWHLAAIYFPAMIGQYTMNFWMPQVLKASSSHYSNTVVGMLVMIPYLVAVGTMILVSRSSDRALERRYHAAIPVLISATALLVLGLTSANSAVFSIVLWCFAVAGVYGLLAPFWSMPNEFLSGFSAAAGIAFINSVGNLGGFVGPYAIGAINRRTGSFRGGLVFASVSLLISAILILALRKRTGQQPLSVPAMAQSSPVMPTAEGD